VRGIGKSEPFYFYLDRYELFPTDGLMKNAETSAISSQSDMTEALKDLEAFMIKAQDMVRLAQDLNERLSASKSPSEPEEATFIRSSLSQLGLEMKNTPVTLDMIKDEKKWEEQLVRELAGVIQGSGPKQGIMRGRGIVGLDEIWGGWNRARGVGTNTTRSASTFYLTESQP
jgi:ESCRT-II complex subunit VPS36